jgi:hypothetical protein
LARAIREKAAAASSELKKSGSSNFSPKKWEGRITQIQKWLGFPDSFMNAWTSLGNGFIRWLIEEQKKSGRVVSENLNVRGKFPILWNRYLDEKNLKDSIDWN